MNWRKFKVKSRHRIWLMKRWIRDAGLFRPLCVVTRHWWGPSYAIGDTGEYDCDCIWCHRGCDCYGDESRWQILRQLLLDAYHAVLCKLGRHVPYMFGDDCGAVCAFCFDKCEDKTKATRP